MLGKFFFYHRPSDVEEVKKRKKLQIEETRSCNAYTYIENNQNF